MKVKTVTAAKKKAGSAAKKRPVSASKKKPAATAKAASAKKRKPAPAVKGKPVTLAKRKLELHEEVMEFVTAAFKGKRIAYFVRDSEQTKEGAYVMCVAVEGEAGFYKMDWGWHCSFAKAQTETAQMNKKLGLNEEEVNKIIISTMGKPVRTKK